MFYIVLCSCCCLPYIFLSFHSTLMSSIQSLAHLFLLQNVSSSGSLSCVFNRLWGRWTTTTTTIRQTRSLTSLLHSDYCASTKKTDEGKLWLLTLKHWRISFVTRFTSLIIQEKNSCLSLIQAYQKKPSIEAKTRSERQEHCLLSRSVSQETRESLTRQW